MTILVVDDYIHVREVIRLMLEGRGHKVVAAADGAAALRLFAEHAIDAAFVDVDMPQMNGLDVCRALFAQAASLGRRIPLWLMTGVMRPELTARAKAGGVRDVIAKPFTTAELVARLEQSVGDEPGLTPPAEIGRIPTELSPAAAQPAATSSVNSDEILSAMSAGCRTFLVLDDDEDNRFLLAHALKRGFPGCNVTTCATADEALHASTQTTFDSVLTDHHLAESDGAAFMARLRSTGARCPVIVVTASSDPKVHARAYAAGASRVFSGVDRDFLGYLQRALPTDNVDAKT